MASQHVYVIDDDILIAQMLCAMASQQGHDCSYFTSPKQFLETPVDDQDIILLDLSMPEMDGIEVIRRLSESHCGASIILISGHDNSVLLAAEKLAKAHQLPVLGSLTKPIHRANFDKLLAKDPQPKGAIGPPPSEQQKAYSLEEIKFAIEHDQMVLHYQPLVDLNNGAVIGVEALARWQHPEHGLRFPDAFIEIIESSSIVSQFTLKILQLAGQQAAVFQSQGINIPISVNVSARNVIDLTLPEQLSRIISTYNLQPSQLKFEVTETALMEELVTYLDILTRLRMKGFGLSIDDFGTGYSSLSLLHRIPFTELKIDRSFIQDMQVDKEALAIVETCVMLGHKLNMKVVAEGIESREIFQQLRGMGCDFAQGYFITKAIAKNKIVDWLKNPPQLLQS